MQFEQIIPKLRAIRRTLMAEDLAVAVQSMVTTVPVLQPEPAVNEQGPVAQFLVALYNRATGAGLQDEQAKSAVRDAFGRLKLTGMVQPLAADADEVAEGVWVYAAKQAGIEAEIDRLAAELKA